VWLPWSRSLIPLSDVTCPQSCGLILSLDAFNIFEGSTVLRCELNLSGRRPDYVNETLAPRIFRLGVRINLW